MEIRIPVIIQRFVFFGYNQDAGRGGLVSDGRNTEPFVGGTVAHLSYVTNRSSV